MIDFNKIICEIKSRGCKILDFKNIHLAIFDLETINKIKTGEKVYESRWTQKKSRPYNKIQNDDLVIIKESCGPVVGFYIAEEVLFYEISEDVYEIMKKYGLVFSTKNEQQIYISSKKYITIMKIDNPVFFAPFFIEKKDSQTWACFK